MYTVVHLSDIDYGNGCDEDEIDLKAISAAKAPEARNHRHAAQMYVKTCAELSRYDKLVVVDDAQRVETFKLIPPRKEWDIREEL